MPDTHTEILPDHILAAVLTLAKRKRKESGFSFRSYDFQLQDLFHNLLMTGKYPILNAYVFSDSGPEPYSPALNDSVSRLQLSGLLGRKNPNYEVVMLNDAAEKFYDEVLSREFDESQRKQLDEIASEFLERIK